MFSHIFKGPGRKRAAPNDDNDDARMSSATKKCKTSHGSVDTEETGKDHDHAMKDVLDNEFLFSMITSFLDDATKLDLATCCWDFYRFFVNQAKVEWNRLSTAATTVDRDQNRYRRRIMTGAVMALHDHHEQQLQQQQQQQGMVWSIWYSLLNRWRRRQFLQKPRMEPHRYWLQYSFKVPLNLYRGCQFGPSCVVDNNPSYDNKGQQLACITAAGVVVLLNGLTMDIDMAEFTRKADPSAIPHLISPRYSWISDKLWYLPKTKKGNDDGNKNKNNNGGFLILKHHAPHVRNIQYLRVLDLTKTNQSIGREGDFDSMSVQSARGIDQRHITPSESFRTMGTHTSVTVSAKHGLIFFVMADHNQGTICIESYDATQEEQQQLVASTHHPAGFTDSSALRHRGMDAIRQLLGILRPLTRAIITQDKLVVVYSCEDEHDPFPLLGFGIYVFDIHDLSFSHYIRMFDAGNAVIDAITADWILYDVPGTTPYNVYNVVQITGGRVGHVGEIRLGNLTSILLVTDVSIYTYDPSELDGNIDIDQFDIITGKKVRTLKTGIPWIFHDDDDDEGGHGLLRMVAAAHVVGNKFVILISSVLSIRNTIVTFALPPSS